MKHVEDAPLSKREIKKAALMFNLVTLWQMNGDANTEEQIDVAEEASNWVYNQWIKHFPRVDMPTTFQGCIDAVKGMRK
jgi:hypothetical protein